MKLVIAFFLCLFYLPGGYAAAHANTGCGSLSHTPAVNIENARVGSVNPERDYLISMDDLSHENTYVINVEDENEENILRKQVYVAGYFLAFFCKILSRHLYGSPSDLLSFSKPDSCGGSCKYILQRVLRI